MTRYGVMTDYETMTEKTGELTVWEGSFMSTLTATTGRIRHGSSTFTLHTYAGDNVRVTLPEGVTMPRTDLNYQRIDEAISEALNAWEKGRGSVQMEAS